jgi:hypothetical protein
VAAGVLLYEVVRLRMAARAGEAAM